MTYVNDTDEVSVLLSIVASSIDGSPMLKISSLKFMYRYIILEKLDPTTKKVYFPSVKINGLMSLADIYVLSLCKRVL